MEFAPTATDYFILIVFALLSLLSGWFTFLVFCARTPAPKEQSAFSHGVRSASGPPEKRGLEKTVADRLTLFETILLVLLNTVVVTSFVLLLTAQFGLFRFRHWCLFFVLYLLSILTYLFLSGKLRPASLNRVTPTLVKSDWLLVPLSTLAFLAFSPPSQAIHTRDPGGYVNIAVKISEMGCLKFEDADYARFNSKDRESLFLPLPLHNVAYPQVIPGFHLVDPVFGGLTPRYFHLFPIWLALAFKLWRFPGMFGLNIFFGILSVLILVPIGSRLFSSRLAGFLAASLLAVNLGQIWIVRSPFSEILTQVFLLAGVWTLSIGMTDRHQGFCRLAGLLFGLALFVRVDSVLALAALIAFSFAVIWLTARGTWLPFPLFSFLAPMLVVTAYAVAHTAIFSYPYVETVINTFRNVTLSIRHVIVAGCSLAVILVLLWKRILRASNVLGNMGANLRALIPPATTRDSQSISQSQILSLSLFVLLTSLFAYGYFVRPLNPGTNLIPLPYPSSGTVPYYDEISLVRLGWYLSPLGILLAYIGSVISLHRWIRGGETVLAPFLLILGVFSVFYLYKSRAFPDNYWVIRRYVEITIPGFLLLASLTLVSLLKLRDKRLDQSRVWKPVASILCAGAFSVMVIWPLRTSYTLLHQREWENTFPQLENLAGTNQDANILLLERGQFQDFFSSPLKFIFHKTVYPLAHDRPDADAFDRLMKEWTRQGKKVNLLASEEQTALMSPKYEFVPKERFRFQTRVVESNYERLPQAVEDLRFTVQVYKVQERSQPVDLTSVGLNLGYHFGFSTTGFYNMELSNDYEPFRWCGARCWIELPELKGSDDAILALRLRRDVPENVAGTPIQVFFNDRLIGKPKLSPKFEVFAFPISNLLFKDRTRNEIRFSSSTYSPAQLGMSDDIRELGFMVHSLKLQLLTPITSQDPYLLDFGAQSDEVDGKLTGFYPREAASFRWSGPVAQIVLDRPLAAESDLKISIRALKSSPNPSFRQFLSVSINGKEIGRAELLDKWDEFRTYDFPIPKGVPRSPQTTVAIKVNPPWTPGRIDTYTDDWRTLGCALDWLKIAATK